MKTKSLFIALAAALCILSGCSKDKNSDSSPITEDPGSMLTEFKRAESFIDQDTATVFNQITKMGYSLYDCVPGIFSFKKVSDTDCFYYSIDFFEKDSDSFEGGTVHAACFQYFTTNTNDVYASTFVDIVRYLGKSYKATFNETLNFDICSYGEEGNRHQIDTYEALDSALDNLVNESNVEIIWISSNNGKIKIHRNLEDHNSVALVISK